LWVRAMSTAPFQTAAPDREPLPASITARTAAVAMASAGTPGANALSPSCRISYQ
jgi:hypothetical protein